MNSFQFTAITLLSNMERVQGYANRGFKTVSNHLNSILTECGSTLHYTKIISYVIITLIIIMVLATFLAWSPVIQDIIIALLAASALYLTVLISRTTCFKVIN